MLIISSQQVHITYNDIFNFDIDSLPDNKRILKSLDLVKEISNDVINENIKELESRAEFNYNYFFNNT